MAVTRGHAFLVLTYDHPVHGDAGGKSPRDHSVPRIGIPGVASGQVVIFGPVIGASGFWGLTSWTQALRALGRDDPVVGGLYGPIESGEDAGCQPSGSFRWPT